MSNLPVSLMASLTNIKGFDKQAFEQVHASGEKVTSIRLNPAKKANISHQPGTENNESSLVSQLLTNDLDQWKPVPWCNDGFYLSARPSFTFDPLFHGGAYYVQEASSMFLWQVLSQTIGDKTDGLKVLDLCAAPGGKSTLLASYFANGLVVANEVIRNRASILAENITKWGSVNTVVTNNDPRDFGALGGFFDVMVIDAPCSGSGLFRKDEDAIAEWSEDNVQLCSQRQQRILADAYGVLKNDGLLIYSTCSYSKQEDEDILDWICAELGAETVKLSLKEEWGITEVQGDKEKAYGYRFYPYLLKGEGFFIAAFKKRGGTESSFRVKDLQKSSKEEIAAAGQFVSSKTDLFYFKQAENIIAIPAIWKADIAILQSCLYLRKAGVAIGALKGKDLVPNHELALSLIGDAAVAKADLNYAQAIQYLQKKEMAVNNISKGWTLAAYAGIALGWMKVLPNRINNYYPVEWRILKESANGL
jgi:NOL1/NOP2/sun family putative RNA methylase